MQLSSQQHQQAASALDQAEKLRKPCPQTSQAFPGMDMEDAYAIQDLWVKHKQSQGERIIGRKIGLTSRAMQEAMGINEPDFGTLLDSMWFENGSEIMAEQFLDPRIEVELAFVLKHDLEGANLTIDDVLRATEFVAPAIEIIAARSPRVDPKSGRTRTVLDTISDNAANAGIILGETHLDPDQIDLRWVGALLYRNGIIEETGLAAGIMDHPALGLCWLARRFSKHGVGLSRGQTFLAGSFTRPIKISAGDDFRVDYGEHGTVTCRFV